MLVFEDERGELREVRLQPGHVHEISVPTRHRMIAVEDCGVLAVTRQGLDDIVRVEES